MKKKLLFILLLVFVLTASGFSASKVSKQEASELDIYNELNIYANAEYYPGVLEQAELLEKNYPESVFIITARIAKGNALTFLNRYDEAEETFFKVLSSLRFGADEYAKCWYFLARASYYGGDFYSALSAFHTVCNAEQRENRLEYYHSSILFAGRINFFMERYEQAVPLLEYVVANGTEYTKAEYDEAIQKLFFSYNSTERHEKTIKLYSKLDAQNYSEKVFSALTIYAADAYENTDQVEKAYETLSSRQNEDFKEMLCFFRLTLGVSAYNKKDYESAGNYLTLAKESSVNRTVITAFIYEQKIRLDIEGKAAASEVENILLEKETEVLTEAEETPGLADTYYALLLRTKAFTEQNDQALSYYEKIQNPGPKDALIAATLLAKKDTQEAEQLIAPYAIDTSCSKLYASLLSANQKYEKAAEIYDSLEKSKKLNDDNRIEYAKVLYHLKKWKDAFRQVQGLVSNPMSLYISGLCEYNLANYQSAYNYLDVYYKSKNIQEQYKRLALYYKGFCAYKMNSYKAAYSDFAAYVKTYTTKDEYLYKSYEYGTKAALMQGQLKNASEMAQGMINASANQTQKQNAIIYCSEILSDNKDYDGAIALLTSYSQEGSDFTIQCLTAIAKVYEKKGEIEKADEQYERIQRDYKGTAAAEEAVYRSGEIYYSAQKYSEAETRFTKYNYSYVDGRYSDAAYYFSGDCNMKNGALDKAIMQNVTLINKYPKSIYSYGAYKNLLLAYYEQENYTDALSTARLLIRDYKDQAASDGIGQRIVELEHIVGGTDRIVVEKIGEYERAGKTSTKKGRNAGSELVQLYAQHDDKEKALSLALELLETQKDGDEMYYAAQNADFVADYYYNLQQSQKAAEYYLKAAEYYRASGQDKDDKAAAALYSAVDSFVSAGLKGDAREIANLLIELYPETKQGKKVMNLLK